MSRWRIKLSLKSLTAVLALISAVIGAQTARAQSFAIPRQCLGLSGIALQRCLNPQPPMPEQTLTKQIQSELAAVKSDLADIQAAREVKDSGVVQLPGLGSAPMSKNQRICKSASSSLSSDLNRLLDSQNQLQKTKGPLTAGNCGQVTVNALMGQLNTVVALGRQAGSAGCGSDAKSNSKSKSIDAEATQASNEAQLLDQAVDAVDNGEAGDDTSIEREDQAIDTLAETKPDLIESQGMYYQHYFLQENNKDEENAAISYVQQNSKDPGVRQFLGITEKPNETAPKPSEDEEEGQPLFGPARGGHDSNTPPPGSRWERAPDGTWGLSVGKSCVVKVGPAPKNGGMHPYDTSGSPTHWKVVYDGPGSGYTAGNLGGAGGGSAPTNSRHKSIFSLNDCAPGQENRPNDAPCPKAHKNELNAALSKAAQNNGCFGGAKDCNRGANGPIKPPQVKVFPTGHVPKPTIPNPAALTMITLAHNLELLSGKTLMVQGSGANQKLGVRASDGQIRWYQGAQLLESAKDQLYLKLQNGQTLPLGAAKSTQMTHGPE